MWNVIVFAVIGLLAGAAARLFYPGRRPTRIMATMMIGLLGAVGGGMISWLWWRPEYPEFHSGNLILSILGAAIVIAFGAVVSYQRSLGRHRTPSA
jgi:uncharacterized membrane protein YeaQ/YmgE (transglycosylase-associated protein family)